MEFTPVDEIAGIVESLRSSYKSGATRSLEWRRTQLKAVHRMIEENEEAIVSALGEDLRRSRTLGLAGEVWDVTAQVLYMLDNLEKFTKKEKLSTPLALKPMSYEVWKEPFGVVTVIAPWNFPIALLLNPLIGALAAGNTCVAKPSEVSAASNRLLAELIPKYIDSSAVRVVSGGVEQTTELLAQKVDSIMYTGGGKVGRVVMAAAAKNLTPVTLELGGQCPVYVDESANLEVAARRLAFAKNVNAGQICIAPDHVLIHHKVRDEFLQCMKAEHAKMFPGSEQENEDKGRIINDAHYNRLKGLLDGHGGKVVFGGESNDADRLLPFTIIVDPSLDSPLMQDEIFGPILPVITVDSIDEAIAISATRPTPLAAYVFQRDSAIKDRWLKEVPSGGACVNDCIYHISNNEGGLGGKGESGMGVTRGKFSFNSFTHRKVVGLQPANFDPSAKYPPYAGNMSALKMLVTQKYPAWVKPLGGAVVAAIVAGVTLFVSKHVSISVSLH